MRYSIILSSSIELIRLINFSLLFIANTSGGNTMEISYLISVIILWIGVIIDQIIQNS